jgi:hypothetical protein
MSPEPVVIQRLNAPQIESLKNLWLTLHRHHQRHGILGQD